MAPYAVQTPRWARALWPAAWWQGPQPAVYLSFDDGPTPGLTDRLLDLLGHHGATASFFVLGAHARQYPRLVQRLQHEGHHVGSHGQHHLDGWRCSAGAYKANVLQGQDVLQQLLGQPVRSFRPPYGRPHPQLLGWLARHTQPVMWSHLPGDFDPHLPLARLQHRLHRALRPHSLVVLHDGPAAKPERLLALVQGALQAGAERRHPFACLNHADD